MKCSSKHCQMWLSLSLVFVSINVFYYMIVLIMSLWPMKRDTFFSLVYLKTPFSHNFSSFLIGCAIYYIVYFPFPYYFLSFVSLFLFFFFSFLPLPYLGFLWTLAISGEVSYFSTVVACPLLNWSHGPIRDGMVIYQKNFFSNRCWKGLM